MKTEDTKTEKEKVMEYVASLPGLDRYVSDDIDLLPEKLYAQALDCWKYEYEIEQVRENGKATPQELETMQSVSEIMKKKPRPEPAAQVRLPLLRTGQPAEQRQTAAQRPSVIRGTGNKAFNRCKVDGLQQGRVG